MTPWSPLASGALSGKYSRTTRPPGLRAHRVCSSAADRGDVRRPGRAGAHREGPRHDRGQASLAWVRQQQPVTSVLVGARTLAQLEDTLASADVVLDAAHLAELDALTTPALDYPHPFVDEVGINFQQGDTTINGLTSTPFQRS
ncbi:aldo/keto reductase [Streptomyces sp. NPDC050844]|uniref:aldo/keto reductase n=1 Tax=Streptomyces sp. NPDC050844 TaxID=3155790 RepID=UPI0033C45B52